MSVAPDELIRSYLDGTLEDDPARREEFDRVFASDPAFSERLTAEMEKRWGRPPDEVLDRLAKGLDKRVPEMLRQGRGEASLPPPRPGAARAFRLLGLKADLAPLLFVVWPLAAFLALLGAYELFSSFVRRGDAGPEPRPLAAPAPGDFEGEGDAGVGPAVPAPKAVAPDLPPLPATQPPPDAENTRKLKPLGAAPKAPAPASGGGSAPSPQRGVPSGEPVYLKLPPAAQTGDGVRIHLDLTREEAVVVSVLDEGGIAVRLLYTGTLAAGRHAVTWDGLDTRGRPAPPGTYTIRVQTPRAVMDGEVRLQAR